MQQSAVQYTAHRARETFELLCRETPNFIPLDIWPSTAKVSAQLTVKIWATMQESAYHGRHPH